MMVLATRLERLQMEAALRKCWTLCQMQHVEPNAVLIVHVDMFFYILFLHAIA